MSGDVSDPHSNERQILLTRLLDAVKQCQVRFGGKTELAADSDSRVSCLCSAWEAVLQHGMRQNSKTLQALNKVTGLTGLTKVADIISDIKGKDSDLDFWQYVKEHLTKHEQERFQALKHISCDTGRGRAWLRASLNEHSLERYMHMLIENEEMLGNYYDSWAFLRDFEKSTMLPMMAAGLGSILFAINIDNPDLNTVRRAPTTVINIPNVAKSPTKEETDPRPVIAGEESPITHSESWKKKDKKKKKKSANIVSFDEDDSGIVSGAQIMEYDHKDHSKKFTQQTYVDTVNSNMEMHTDLSQDVPVINIHNESSPETGVNNDRPKVLSFNREPSVNSGNSFDRPPSQNSFSSTDFELSDTGGHMMPILNGQPVNMGMVPISSDADMVLGRSVDSEDSHVFEEDVKSARAALAMVQKGSVSYRTAGDGGNVEGQIKTDKMNTEELKQAVISMMVRKDEVEEQNRNLQAMLQQEMLTSSSLRAEIEEMKQVFIVKQEKEAAKYQTLQKENELLKHQLRRYVNAVQMLRAEGSQVDENLGIHLEDPQPNIPPAKSNIDYSHEASEYEKKLIQVAEMHGELMEFNEMLHRQLNSKEALLRRLQQELVDLRGPLPRDLQSLTDETSIDTDSLSLQLKNLVNIWIPSAFLQGSASDSHHVYQVYIRIKDEEWNIYRRYNQFYQLHVKLKKAYPLINKYDFPKKKTIGNKGAKVVESRRRTFQTYLRNVINFMLEKSESFVSGVNKIKLIELIPFFGEQVVEQGGKGGGKNGKSKKKASASAATLSSSPASAEPTLPTQPEYDGL